MQNFNLIPYLSISQYSCIKAIKTPAIRKNKHFPVQYVETTAGTTCTCL